MKVIRILNSAMLLLAVALPSIADSQVRLTDVVTFGADAAGTLLYQPDVWETRPNGNYNNWLQSLPDGTFLNGPSDSEAQPNVTLLPGTNSFRIYGSPGIDNPKFGINLFFNGSLTPAISAFGPMLTNVAQVHSFSPNSGSPTPQAVPVYNSGIPGAGTLSFTSGNQLITLTDFYLATPAVFNMDQGGQTVLGPDGILDYVGGFTLVITTTNTATTCTPPPSGLVAWWAGEGNADDSIGGNSGIVSSGMTYTTGEVGQSFLLDNTNAYFHAVGSSNLNVGQGSGFTIEAWIKPSNVNGLHPILEWNTASGELGVQFWIGQNPWSQGVLCAFVMDTNGNNYIQVPSPAGTLVANTWQHVATTYDRSTHTIKVFVNGIVVAQSAWSGDVPQTGYDLWVGHRPQDCSGCWTDGTFLSGPLDELSIYNRALSPTEISAIFAAGSAGKCPPEITNSTPFLIDVDFGGGGIRPSEKTGLAAIGSSGSDFWNFYTRDDINGNWLTFGVLPNLKLVDGTVTSVGMTVANAPGDWGNGSTDPMFNDFIYPFNGGNVTITITNLPPGSYDLYAYSANSRYQITSGGTTYGIKSAFEPVATNPPVWIEGVSYALFTNIVVTAGQPLVLTALPLYDVANISGLQIISSGTNNLPPPDCTPPPSGLVSWWPGEGNADDILGSNNGTLLGGTSFIGGEVGQAFSFNGISNYLSVPDSPALDSLTNQITIELWLKANSLSANPDWQGIVTKGNSSWRLQATTFAKTVYLALNGVTPSELTGTRVVNDGQWHHVAAVYDGATMSLYVDGTLDVSQPATGLIAQNNDPLCIGANAKAWDFSCGCVRTGYFYNGSIDEASIYNRALSPTEISAIFAAGSAGKCPLPPTVFNVTPASWHVNEGATVAYTVTAGGAPALAYQWQHESAVIPGATNATLTLSNVVYAQAGNYSVTVSNLAGMAISSNVTLRVNRAPVADASASESLVISPNGTNATVVLDGSRSSDPDGDALTYAWFHTGDASPFATGTVAIETLPTGTNQLTLTVNDGMASAAQNFLTEVITTSQAVDRLVALVKSGSLNTQPLIASLRAALAAIDRSHPDAAINQLEAFINKVQVLLEPTDPVLAAQLIADAQAIIDALKDGSSGVVAQVKITAISHDANGKAHLKINGISGRFHVIEASTNMVDWVRVGVATRANDGSYEFDDTQLQGANMRFYRIVSPK